VRPAQLAKAPRAERREPQAHDAVVERVGMSGHEAGVDRAVDEADRAVVTEQQRIGQVPDRRARVVLTASNREQQLVLRRCDADGRRLLLTPAQEFAQSGSKIEQASVVVVVRLTIVGHHNSYDDMSSVNCEPVQYIVTR